MHKPVNPETDPFYTIEIDVPSDAWMCDFVFSSGVGEGAQYDNRGGKDYHLPTNGSTEKAPPLHIINILPPRIVFVCHAHHILTSCSITFFHCERGG